MRRTPHLWSLLLVPAGLVAGHLLGYRAAGLLGAAPPVTGGHSYLQGVVCLAVPFSLAVLARALLSGVSSESPPVRFPLLAAAQVGLFVLVELAEHAAAGVGPVDALLEPATFVGVLAQLVVAWALWFVVRAATRAGSRLVSQRRPVPKLAGFAAPWRPVDGGRSIDLVAVSSLSRRGPPALVA